jgi:hypothetical protein
VVISSINETIVIFLVHPLQIARPIKIQHLIEYNTFPAIIRMIIYYRLNGTPLFTGGVEKAIQMLIMPLCPL